MIRACAERSETWISDGIIQSYCKLHAIGCAHSVEAWRGNELAGGLYGVALGGAFLLLGAALVHWDFAALFAAVLLGLLLVLLPESVAARRRGASVLATPSGGVARVLGGAVLGAGLLLLLSPGTPQQPGGNRSSFRGKLHIFAPLFHFGVLGPVAAGGAVAMAVPARPRRWRSAAPTCSGSSVATP